MIVEKNRNVVVFDVDDTLILWDEKSRDLKAPTEGRTIIICPYDNLPYSFKVHNRHVAFLKREKAKGSFVVVWSKSEGAWAEAVCKALGLEDYVNIAMSKPSKYVDDIKDIEAILGSHIFLDKDGHSV
jgi:predicted HAD superfamily phosphohydrolase YqeG